MIFKDTGDLHLRDLSEQLITSGLILMPWKVYTLMLDLIHGKEEKQEADLLTKGL